MLRAGEDQRRFHIQGGQQVIQQVTLIGLIDVVEALFDRFDRRCFRLDSDAVGVVQEGRSQIGNLRRHGCGEEERLLLLRGECQDPLHVMDETHVQHAVRLVQDHDLDTADVDQSLPDQVNQASGRGDEDVAAAGQFVLLLLLRDTTIDNNRPELEAAAVAEVVIVYLDGQLAGQRQDQRSDRASRAIILDPSYYGQVSVRWVRQRPRQV